MMSYIFEIFVIFAYIVFFLKLFGGKYQAKGAGREIIQCPPDIDIYEQAFPRMVEMIGLLLLSVIERDGEGTVGCNDEFLTFLMGMAPTAFSARNVVGPVGTGNGKGNVGLSLCHCQVASWVEYLG